MEAQISPAKISELQGIQRLFRRVISVHYRPFLGEKGVNVFINSGQANQYIEEHLSHTVMQIMDDTVIGLAVFEGDHLARFMIEPSFHRMGFGTQLLEYCEQTLFKEHSRIQIDVFTNNKKGNAFFQKHGWSAQSTRSDAKYESDITLYSKEK